MLARSVLTNKLFSGNFPKLRRTTMKRIFAVVLLLVSFASAALADGPGFPPTGTVNKPSKAGVVLLADGPFLPPPPSKPSKVGVALLADGGMLPPPPTKPATVKIA
jgi:hypothetical protein